MSKKDNKLTCTLDRYEKSQAVLVFNISKENTQELILPKRFLPKKAKIGSTLHFEIYTDALAHMNQRKMAQYVLDEIINNDN